MHRLPLLVPVPLHTTSVEAAQRLDFGLAEYPPLIVRCRTCLESRWCERYVLRFHLLCPPSTPVPNHGTCHLAHHEHTVETTDPVAIFQDP